MYNLKIFATVALAIALMIFSSSYVSGQSSPTVPGKPTGLTATVISASQINLSWSAPSNNGGSSITGYKIEYKIIPNNYALLTQINGNTTTSYSHTGLQADKYYVYRVYAINSIGTSEPSAEMLGHTEEPENIVPNPPTNLNVKAISPTKINLFWTTSSSNNGPIITGYKIEEKVGSGSYSVIVANTGNTNTVYSRTGLAAGNTYTYRVSTINSVGTSNSSNESSASQTLSIVPNSPTGLTATSASPTQINLSWNSPSGNGGPEVTGYKIEFKTGSSSYSVLANTGTTTYSHTGLTTGTTYTYRVSAINSVGTSTPSNEDSEVPTKTLRPALTAVAVAPTQINLSWIPPSETYGQQISGYKVERKLSEGVYVTVADNTGGTTYSVTGLTTGTTYTFVVSAQFSLGGTDRSNEASATPLSTSSPPPATPSSSPTTPSTTVPNSPTGLTVDAMSSSQINLSWSAPSSNGGSSITGYKIERKVGSDSYSVLVTNIASIITKYSNTGLTAGTTYTYRVSAINSVGTSNPSNEASLILQSASPTPTPTPKPTPTPDSTIGRIKVVDTDYALRYEIIGGKVSKTEVNVETNSLHIDVDTTDDGKLTIPLPRSLIDAKAGDKDDVFYVLADDEEAEYTEIIASNSRTLEIVFPEGTEEITIYGTQSVPEFSTIAMLVLGAGFGMIYLTRNKHFNSKL